MGTKPSRAKRNRKSKAGDDRPRETLSGVIVEPLRPLTPEEAEAVAQRLAALILRTRANHGQRS